MPLTEPIPLSPHNAIWHERVKAPRSTSASSTIGTEGNTNRPPGRPDPLCHRNQQDRRHTVTHPRTTAPGLTRFSKTLAGEYTRSPASKTGTHELTICTKPSAQPIRLLATPIR
jgi:hypothetical protein